ncbi:MAG: isoprenylcysteine carboxylmethyltransferase family protein [Ignavibacteriales bacterium]|nr:isoprenylcysteine carboxylmethyltransferase family protein [Ignavibacteriales bacterium]
MDDGEIVVLVIGTLGLMFFTWDFSVKAGRFHGLYRFFAFESILLLCLLNWRFWFVDPFSWHQVISWLLLCGSIIPAVDGFRLLRAVGKPAGQFENTTRLVKVGSFKYIRHPLYASLIILGLGIFFKQLSWAGGVCAMIDVAAIVGTAQREEKEMLEKFGEEYAAYIAETKMFIPYVL